MPAKRKKSGWFTSDKSYSSTSMVKNYKFRKTIANIRSSVEFRFMFLYSCVLPCFGLAVRRMQQSARVAHSHTGAAATGGPARGGHLRGRSASCCSFRSFNLFFAAMRRRNPKKRKKTSVQSRKSNGNGRKQIYRLFRWKSENTKS